MIKEVRYNGYAAQPSEYLSEDGDLGVSMNLVPEDGGLKGINSPIVVHRWSEGVAGLYIHRSSQYKHILYCDNAGIYWAEMSEEDNSFEEDRGNKVIALESGEVIKGVVAIGNTLVITTSQSMRYVLWRDEKYIDLGSKLPFVGIEFDMHYWTTHEQLDIYREFDNLPPSIAKQFHSYGSSSSVEDTPINRKNAINKITEAVYGDYLALEASVKEDGGNVFTQPMMVRYALKMYDGTYVMHSAPVLLMSTAYIPRIHVTERGSSSNGGGSIGIAKYNVYVRTFGLSYRVVDVPDMTLWKDLIQSVDVFISKPIYTWKQSEPISEALMFTRDTTVSEKKVISSDAAETIFNAFAGHYDGEDMTEEYSTLTSSTFWNVAKNERIEEDIKTTHLFYKVMTLKASTIAKMDAFNNSPKFDVDDFSALETLPTLEDDYNSHSKLVGEFQYAYNNRLNLANVEYFAGDTLPIRTMGAWVKPAEGVDYVPLTIDVWIKKEGKEIVATQTIDVEASEANPFAWANVAMRGATFPRWIYYPDAGAYKMRVSGDGWNKTFYLTPHDFLNGAYWWGGLGIDVEFGELPIIPTGEIKATSVQMGNKLYTSEAENPWVFPASGVRAIGDGDIVGIASAARALSEGQFGQFPLYAFTTEGVWSLAVTDTGMFNPAQPISRDVCVDSKSITQIDQSVLFATKRGVMMIAGSETVCMTDLIDTDNPSCLLEMPGGRDLAKMCGIDVVLDVLPFGRFLEDCRIVYDYTNQRITLYNSNCGYAYVYSLKSKAWGLCESKLKESINAYPEAMANTENELIDLSSDKGEMRKGLLLTRALKLDGGDILKTIDTIIQRGDFVRGQVSTILWGSRDLKHWHLVWTSKDHYLRGFRGTPYKYYRIGAITKLKKEESLVGASINFNIKQTNQLR